MSPKDVKLLARKYDIPLYLHPCASSEGWTMDKLRYEVIDRRAIPDAMAWRHHDPDVNDVLPDNDFSILDVRALAENAINLRPMHPELLFTIDLATVWDFPRYHPIFKDTGDNVVTMSEYLRFPFFAGISIEKGVVVPANHQAGQNTTPPLWWVSPSLTKLNINLRWKLKDPKVIAAREKKKVQAARATAKKKENLKRTDDKGGSSKPKLKKRKTQAKKANTTSSDHVFSPIPIHTITPTGLVAPARSGSGGHNDEAQTALEDDPFSPHQSAYDLVNNFINIVDDKDKESPPELSHSSTNPGGPLTLQLKESFFLKPMLMHHLRGRNVEEGESSWSVAIYVPDWNIPHRCRMDTPMWYRDLMVHLAPPAAQEESNALTNEVALQRAWFRLADSHTECSDTVWKLVIVRRDLEHNARLYTGAINLYKELK
ncbi:hypothetical protein Tco_0694956 [Tanacetum coccineum]